MTINDILELAKAGYTKDDIAKLTAAQPAPAVETGTVKPAPQFDNSNEKKPAAEQAQPAADPAIAAMQAQIDTLKQMMQINSVLTANMQNAPKERTIDDIFAEIINPPAQDKGKEGN